MIRELFFAGTVLCVGGCNQLGELGKSIYRNQHRDELMLVPEPEAVALGEEMIGSAGKRSGSPPAQTPIDQFFGFSHGLSCQANMGLIWDACARKFDAKAIGPTAEAPGSIPPLPNQSMFDSCTDAGREAVEDYCAPEPAKRLR